MVVAPMRKRRNKILKGCVIRMPSLSLVSSIHMDADYWLYSVTFYQCSPSKNTLCFRESCSNIVLSFSYKHYHIVQMFRCCILSWIKIIFKLNKESPLTTLWSCFPNQSLRLVRFTEVQTSIILFNISSMEMP